ncbi:MAG: hypothetical protein KDC82_04870, partial [Bacteroidetes bacterium]|nr:hypothetical protein [Bacteroidota bacterium]
MPGRSFTSESYRYGFNGMEKDGEEWTGNDGSHLDFGARIYDSRLGRWFARDPLEDNYPFASPYQFAGNTPIWCIDLDGLEEAFATDYTDDEGNPKRQIWLNPNADPNNPEDVGTIQFKTKRYDGTPTSDILPANESDLLSIKELRASELNQKLRGGTK